MVINNMAGNDTALSFVGSRCIQLNWNKKINLGVLPSEEAIHLWEQELECMVV